MTFPRALLLAAASSTLLQGQTVVTLDGTSGANALSIVYSMNVGLTLSLGSSVWATTSPRPPDLGALPSGRNPRFSFK